jgi:hypothetical protein
MSQYPIMLLRVRTFVPIAGWLLLAAGTVMIAATTAADFRLGGMGLFISQKGELARQPLWLFCLRLHVVAGMVCLM